MIDTTLLPEAWGTATETLEKQATGTPQPTPYPWMQGIAGTQQAMVTGLPTQAPDPLLRAGQQATEMARFGRPTEAPDPLLRAGQQATEMARFGRPTEIPDIWQRMGGLIEPMAMTGAPTSQEPWYTQAKQVAGRDIAQSIGQAAEQAGLKGMRWSSPLARQAQEIAARRMGEVGLEWTGRELGAQEAARQRQLQAMQLGQQLGGGIAGLGEAKAQRQLAGITPMLQAGIAQANLGEGAAQRQLGALPYMIQAGMGQAGLSEAARQRQFGALPLQLQFGGALAGLGESAQQRALQATGQLAPLGQMQAQLPMDIAQRAMQMGGTMQQQGIMEKAPLMQEFMRGTPEASPWLNLLMGATQMPFTQQAQQYQPSFMSQMLGGLGAGASMCSSAQFKKDISEISDKDEEKIFEQMKHTPIFKYRYKFEDDETTPHLGLITEESPDELTLFNNKAVGLYEYISTLHAMIKVLSRKIEKLEI